MAKRSARPAVVIVIGASSGIGLAAALRFAARGDHLHLLARSGQALDQAARQCRTGGASTVETATVDVRDRDSLTQAVDQARRSHGQIDVVVLSAAVMAYGTIEDLPPEVLLGVVDTSIHGTVHVAHAVLPVFRTQGYGTLVVVNSLLGSVTVPAMGAYATAKWGQRAFVRTLQQEIRDQPAIHVCLVSPGSINTPIYRLAANWLSRAPRPPWPVMAPERVAVVIERLTAHPRQSTSFLVGYSNPLITAGYRIAPFVYDRIVGPLFARAALTDDPVAPTPGNVHQPRPELEALHGLWPPDPVPQDPAPADPAHAHPSNPRV